MPSLRHVVGTCALVTGCALAAGCTNAASTTEVTAARTTAATTTVVVPTTTQPTPSTSAPTSTTSPPPLTYVFPFTGKKVSYGHKHHDYPASDVFGCGAGVVAPVRGTVEETRTTDPWVPKVDDP